LISCISQAQEENLLLVENRKSRRKVKQSLAQNKAILQRNVIVVSASGESNLCIAYQVINWVTDIGDKYKVLEECS